jgi:hypothetical protein
MFDKLSRSDRRTFLRNAGMMYMAMHAPSAGLTWANGMTPIGSDAPKASTPVDFKRLDLRSNRMDEQREYYTKLFPFPLVDETSDSFTIQTGKSQIRFVNDDNAHDQVLCHFAFNIPENQLESAMEWVQKRWPLIRNRREGGHVVHFRNINAHSVYWFDQSGHLLEFIAQHDLPNARTGDFDETGILQACEIGLVTPDVVATCDELELKTGLRVRTSSRGNTVFSPTGDRYGYFIVVKQERVWLMTDIPSTQVPIRVTMSGETPGKVKLTGIPFEIDIVT